MTLVPGFGQTTNCGTGAAAAFNGLTIEKLKSGLFDREPVDAVDCSGKSVKLTIFGIHRSVYMPGWWVVKGEIGFNEPVEIRCPADDPSRGAYIGYGKNPSFTAD